MNPKSSGIIPYIKPAISVIEIEPEVSIMVASTQEILIDADPDEWG